MNSSTQSCFHSGSSWFLYSVHTSLSVMLTNAYRYWSSQVSFAIALPTGSGPLSAGTSSGDVAAAAHVGSAATPSTVIGLIARGTYTVPGGAGAFDRSTSITRAITARSCVCGPDAAMRSPTSWRPIAISPTVSVAVAAPVGPQRDVLD